MRLAVSVVTWRQAAIRMPSSGFSFSKRSRILVKTGICRSAHSTFNFPSSARPMSATSCSVPMLISLSVRELRFQFLDDLDRPGIDVVQESGVDRRELRDEDQGEKPGCNR